MTSIKLKFRPSTTPGKEGSIVFQLIYGRTVYGHENEVSKGLRG
ncbi:hypothetical protein [Paraprevotella xylaniphila]|nr:hypothetical protein [Paraprevotella xylaniphila]